MHLFWDTATYWLKIANFSTARSFNALDLGEPFRISGLTFYSGKSLGSLIVANTGLCIVSYANAL